jgi:hypothetical protein
MEKIQSAKELKEIDKFAARLDDEIKIKLARQEKSAISFLQYYEKKLRQENEILFSYMINTKIPYWIKWIKKYKWMPPSMPMILNELWELYIYFKWRKDAEKNVFNKTI